MVGRGKFFADDFLKCERTLTSVRHCIGRPDEKRNESNRKVVDKGIEIDILVLGESNRQTDNKHEDEHTGSDKEEEGSSAAS